MNELESENICKVFFPNGMSIDAINMRDAEAWHKKNKFSFYDKTKLLSIILQKYDIKQEEIVKRLKKCLPNGKNKFLSYSDSEYETLKKEFNI